MNLDGYEGYRGHMCSSCSISGWHDLYHMCLHCPSCNLTHLGVNVVPGPCESVVSLCHPYLPLGPQLHVQHMCWWESCTNIHCHSLLLISCIFCIIDGGFTMVRVWIIWFTISWMLNMLWCHVMFGKKKCFCLLFLFFILHCLNANGQCPIMIIRYFTQTAFILLSDFNKQHVTKSFSPHWKNNLFLTHVCFTLALYFLAMNSWYLFSNMDSTYSWLTINTMITWLEQCSVLTLTDFFNDKE